MATYLPLTNNPEETFNIPIDAIVYEIRQLWNGYGFWTLDISDNDGNVLITGIKIVAGETITKQYPELPFDLTSDSDTDPTVDNLDAFQLEVIIR